MLRGVDGVVFVCDSQWEKMRENLESIRNLRSNLASYNYSLDIIPYVVQFNKRDLPSISPVNYLQYVVNPRQVPSFDACALSGQNVFETLNCVCGLVLTNLRSKQQDGSL